MGDTQNGDGTDAVGSYFLVTAEETDAFSDTCQAMASHVILRCCTADAKYKSKMARTNCHLQLADNFGRGYSVNMKQQLSIKLLDTKGQINKHGGATKQENNISRHFMSYLRYPPHTKT